MSGRRSRTRSRARPSRNFPQDCYGEVAGSLDDRPAFDTTPFDPTGGSAWDTLPSESIFDTTDSSRPRSNNDWLSSPEHNEMVSYTNSTPHMAPFDDGISLGSHGATAGGYYSGTASPLLRRGLNNGTSSRNAWNSTTSGPSGKSRLSSGPSPTRSTGMDFSGSLPASDGLLQFADCSDSAGVNYPQFDGDTDDDDDHDDDSDDFTSFLSRPPPQGPIIVDTSPLPPWKPYRASERLEDPNNPPPMFHPAFANEWRTDPNISEDLRNYYASTLSEYSPDHCIFDYGRLSEFNTRNVYSPEEFDGPNEQGAPTPARTDDCTEVFGDPHEALARPTDEVPDKFRKEKWRYFEVKKRLELFKQLGMDTDLAMCEGQLERMEADPWTGDDSGRDVQVYLPGTEFDPAWDDDLLEKMEALVSPSNEGLRAFYAAMENPPPPRDEFATPHGKLEQTEQLSPTNEGGREFSSAMENPPPDTAEHSVLNESFQTSSEGDASQTGDIDLNESFQTCYVGEDSQIEDSGLNTSFTLPNLNTSFTLPEGPSVDFPPGTGPDGC